MSDFLYILTVYVDLQADPGTSYRLYAVDVAPTYMLYFLLAGSVVFLC